MAYFILEPLHFLRNLVNKKQKKYGTGCWDPFVVQNFISANFTALLLLEWGAVQRGGEIVFKLETILLLPSKEQTSKGLFSWNIQSFWNKTTNFFNVSKSIAWIANAALHKCPGKPSLNVNHVFPVFYVCPVCSVCGITLEGRLLYDSPIDLLSDVKEAYLPLYIIHCGSKENLREHQRFQVIYS